MSISENIFALTDQMFYMSDFSVVKKSVTPPCDFVCSYNSVLYERFFYVVKGTIIFDDERHKNLSFSAGDIIYLPAHTVYRSRWDTKEEGYFISLNFIISDSNRKIINLADDITLCCNDKSGKLYHSFCETYDSWEKASPGYKLECMSRLINVMREIAVRSERYELGKDNPWGDRGTVLSSPFSTDLKGKYTKKFHANRVTIRQISRLCGETKGLVEKHLR